MKIAMIGSGSVGLVSGVCFANFGHQVVRVDKDEGRIDALLRGKIPIFEPGLDALVEADARNRRLVFSTDLDAAVAEAEVVFIVVGAKSAAPVGTGDEAERIIAETRPDAAFAVCSNPEFLREGAAINDFKLPDRIVVGTSDARRFGFSYSSIGRP